MVHQSDHCGGCAVRIAVTDGRKQLPVWVVVGPRSDEQLSSLLVGLTLWDAHGVRAIETAVDVRDQLVPARCEHLQVEVEVVLDGFGDVGLSVSAIQSPSHAVDVFGQGSFGCESGGVELQSFTGFEDFEHVLRRCTSLERNLEF